MDYKKAWKQVAAQGLGKEWIDLLREAYRETKVVARWLQEMTAPVANIRGRKMLYCRKLQECSQGFSLRYMEEQGKSG